MKKYLSNFVILIVTFIILSIFVSDFGAAVHWGPNVKLTDLLNYYFVRWFPYKFGASVVIAIIICFIRKGMSGK